MAFTARISLRPVVSLAPRIRSTVYTKSLFPCQHNTSSSCKLFPASLSRAMCASTTGRIKNEGSDKSIDKWAIKMLYDGECPLCMREVNMLKQRNSQYKTIKFVDISSNDYSPEENAGLDYETVMGRIHAIERNGKVITDIVAFRRLYEEVGLGWVYTLTKYKLVEALANAIYAVWAKYRLPITGRPPLEKLLETRKQEVPTCEKGVCK